jgi:hypothetical protein
MYTNAVYFPSSRIYQGDSPGMLNYGCINHVYYAYASVTADGNVFVSFDESQRSHKWQIRLFSRAMVRKKLRIFHLHDVARLLTCDVWPSSAMSGPMQERQWMVFRVA